ncbi:MAG: hydantoinase/oxoprolinase family protein, partial [Gammaproteobacteria bacterium]|nr:hydantoinase/oxoprolinase family protein [Gammaproteobacteria bacterium]
MKCKKNLRLAVDIGGTFTDIVLMNDEGVVVSSTKIPTTHSDPSMGVLGGLKRMLNETGSSIQQIGLFIHGTTLATNALIEKRGAKVASITTEGFRDILEIAYERRYDQYDVMIDKPDLLVPRSRCFTVPERISWEGEVIAPLDNNSITSLVNQIDACGASAIAICLLHAYANGKHEQAVRESLLQRRPQLSISVSSEVSPEAREFDRLCTTIANAYIQPLMSTYLTNLASEVKSTGLDCPILMITASGGMTTIETAARLPIRLVESGPAGGAVLAARIAEQCSAESVLSFDMGGTTAKLCLIDNYRPQQARHFEIARAARFIKGSGMPVRIPVLEMIEIGAGGGSIAQVDTLGRLHVGPKSAGSEPGPAAYGNGGQRATVSDADLALGYLDPDTFADGLIKLDVAANQKALQEDIANPLSLSVQQAASGVSNMVNENMANAARMHAVESGKDLGDRLMIAFGGTGPLHATRIARRAGVKRILVPPNPGVGSAVGFLFAPISFEIVKSHYTLLKNINLTDINAFLAELINDAAAVVKTATRETELEHHCVAFMRYQGQGHEIEITLPATQLNNSHVNTLEALFDAEYQRQYSRPVPGMSIEILNWGVSVSTGKDDAHRRNEPDTSHAGKSSAGDAVITRKIICDKTGEEVHAQIIQRDALKIGDEITGPALITE